MNKEEHEQLLSKVISLRSDNLVAYFFTLTLLFTTALMYFFANFFSHSGFVLWFISVILFAFTLFQWSILQHDFFHNYFYEKKSENITWGLFASLFTLVPFYDSKLEHLEHHDRIGSNLDPERIQLQISEKYLPYFTTLWKYHIPLLTPTLLIIKFWNLKNLKSIYQGKHILRILSYLLPLIFHLYLITDLAPLQYFKTWGIAYIFYFYMCDLFLLSQHIQGENGSSEVSNQDELCRDVELPNLVEKFFFLGFNRHGLHHLIPNLPGYHLCMIQAHEVKKLTLLELLKLRHQLVFTDLNSKI